MFPYITQEFSVEVNSSMGYEDEIDTVIAGLSTFVLYFKL
jgi:hypothetical protein